MTTSYTPNLSLAKPAAADRAWDVPVNANADAIDASALGGLAVTLHEQPSTTLLVKVSPGTYRKSDRTLGTYAGTASQAVTASATTRLWLTDAGVLTAGASYPANADVVRLASVTAGATTITAVTDDRTAWPSGGLSRLSLHEAANGAMGRATLAAGTVTVANTLVTANSEIFAFCQVPGGTPGWLQCSARVAGTSFTLLSSSNTDSSVVAWLIVEPSP